MTFDLHSSPPPTIAVLAAKPERNWYFQETLPRIAKYAAKHGYGLYIERRNFAAVINLHPSWGKLMLCIHTPPTDSPVILWDADLVPMWHAPSIMAHIHNHDQLAMVWYGRTRATYRKRYPKWRKMGWNCGLVYVPSRLRIPLAGLFGQHNLNHVFWEQGAINDFVLRHGEHVQSLDGRWSKWVRSPTIADCRSNYCLHFAHGGKRNQNIGMLCKVLRVNGTRW